MFGGSREVKFCILLCHKAMLFKVNSCYFYHCNDAWINSWSNFASSLVKYLLSHCSRYNFIQIVASFLYKND